MRKLAVLLIVLAASTAADAKPKPRESAKVHIDRAEKAHKAGQFDEALAELKTAYELDAQPKLLFAIAQVYAKLDRCAEAIEYYEKFDAATKDESKQVVVQQAIEACRKRLADKPDKPDPGVFRAKKPAEEQPMGEPTQIDAALQTKPAETQPPDQTPVAVPAAKPPAEIRPFDEPAVKPAPVAPAPVMSVTAPSAGTPWYRDTLGDALVIGGVGAIVGSVLTYRSARSDIDSADKATSLDSYNEHRDSAERKQLLTGVLAGGGLALVVTGVLRFALRDRGNESRSVVLVPTERGGFITWSEGF